MVTFIPSLNKFTGLFSFFGFIETDTIGTTCWNTHPSYLHMAALLHFAALQITCIPQVKVLDFCAEERQAFVEPTFTFCFLLLALTFTFYFSLDPGIWGPIFETLSKFNWYDSGCASGWWRCQLNTDNATWWPNLQSVQVAPSGDQNVQTMHCNGWIWLVKPLLYKYEMSSALHRSPLRMIIWRWWGRLLI